jgi:hypothetical protein
MRIGKRRKSASNTPQCELPMELDPFESTKETPKAEDVARIDKECIQAALKPSRKRVKRIKGTLQITELKETLFGHWRCDIAFFDIIRFCNRK